MVNNIPLLVETPIRVVTDDRTAYLSPGAKDRPVRIKVFERGGPTTADTMLYLFEYANVIQTPTAKAGTKSCQDGIRPNQTVASQPKKILSFPAQVVVPAGQGYQDWFEVKVSATGSGATILSYQLQNVMFGTGIPDGVTGVPVWSTADYSAIRVYANDDFSDLYAKGDLQWADVYNAVLRYYYVVYPAMSTFIPLNLPDSIVQQGALIKQRLHTCDQPGFYTTYNMPLTRTMSPAKIKLVLDFIGQQQQKKATSPAASTNPSQRNKKKAAPTVSSKKRKSPQQRKKKSASRRSTSKKTGPGRRGRRR